MAGLTLAMAADIVEGALRRRRELSLAPLTVAVVDDGGHLKALQREDGPGASLRPHIAIGKAAGAVGMGRSSRVLESMALERPHFMAALAAVSQGRLVPVPGGVPFMDANGVIIGAVGVTGDSSDNDEAAALAGIAAAGLEAAG